jgi:hypothetical protein
MDPKAPKTPKTPGPKRQAPAGASATTARPKVRARATGVTKGGVTKGGVTKGGVTKGGAPAPTRKPPVQASGQPVGPDDQLERLRRLQEQLRLEHEQAGKQREQQSRPRRQR